MDSETALLTDAAAIPKHAPARGFVGAVRKMFHPALIPAAVFFLLAAGLIINWRIIGKYRPTGDEPHYMVIANSLTRYHTLETTPAYRDMFNTTLLALFGQEPGPHNTHAVAGPHGLYSVHNIGLPILISIPLMLSGVTAARMTMALIASGLGALAYAFAGVFTQDRRLRVLLAIAVACAAPFLPSAGQIYPDLPAGLLFGLALLTISRGALGPWDAPARPLPRALTAAAIAFAPWLQIKFAAASLLSCAGCVCWAGTPRRNIGARIAIFAMPLAVSMALLAAYNRYAFGTLTGPYESGALVANWHALMVLIGLHIDQFQGIFVLDPMLLLAPIGAAAIIRRKPAFGVFFALLYASLVVPNAMHPNWYGGFSFAARFVLSGGVLLILPAVYGLRVLRASKSAAISLCALSLCVQAAYLAKYQSLTFSLYNQQHVPFIELYTTLFEPLQEYLPQFCNIGWAYRFLPNYGWLAGLLALPVIGWQQARRGHHPSRLAWVLAAGFPLAGSAAAAVWQPTTTKTLVYAGANLPGLTGHVQGNGRVAMPGRDQPNFLTYGPYVSLPGGKYRVELVYASGGASSQHVGDWDIVSNAGTEILAGRAAMPGTGGHPATLTSEIDIGSARDGLHLEIRTMFAGVAPVDIESITIQKL